MESATWGDSELPLTGWFQGEAEQIFVMDAVGTDLVLSRGLDWIANSDSMTDFSSLSYDWLSSEMHFSWYRLPLFLPHCLGGQGAPLTHQSKLVGIEGHNDMWIVGRLASSTTLPALLRIHATVFVSGCCLLPSFIKRVSSCIYIH